MTERNVCCRHSGSYMVGKENSPEKLVNHYIATTFRFTLILKTITLTHGHCQLQDTTHSVNVFPLIHAFIAYAPLPKDEIRSSDVEQYATTENMAHRLLDLIMRHRRLTATL